MRYRLLDTNKDYTFGQGSSNYLVNIPQTVAQAIFTRLLLYQGEWFLDTTTGMPWYTQVVGNNTTSLYDTAIKTLIVETPGVAQLIAYNSVLDRVKRHLTVNASVLTIFSNNPIPISATLTGAGYGIGPYGGLPYGN